MAILKKRFRNLHPDNFILNNYFQKYQKTMHLMVQYNILAISIFNI